MKKVFGLIKKKWWLVAILLIVALVVGLVWKPWQKPEAKTAVIERGQIKEELVLSGKIAAIEHAKLGFATAGELKWVGVSQGQLVKKGQLLAYLDVSKLKTAAIAAENSWLAADATAKRAEDQVKDHDADETFVQKELRVVNQTARDAAYFNWQQAQRNLRDAYIYAPFAGIVTQVAHPYANVFVLGSEMQIEILNPETIYFSVAADQTEIGDLKPGQKVKIVLDSFDEEEFEGTITTVAYTPQADGNYEVKVSFGQVDQERFRIGMTGDASFVTKIKDNVLMLPRTFVNSDRQGKYLNLESPKNKVYVEVGIEGAETVEVTGEIKEGQTVYD